MKKKRSSEAVRENKSTSVKNKKILKTFYSCKNNHSMLSCYTLYVWWVKYGKKREKGRRKDNGVRGRGMMEWKRWWKVKLLFGIKLRLKRWWGKKLLDINFVQCHFILSLSLSYITPPPQTFFSIPFRLSDSICSSIHFLLHQPQLWLLG